MDEPKQIVVEVEVVDVYGKPTFYPINHTAEMLAHIAGTKTLTPQTLKLAMDMGITVDARHRLNPMEVLANAT
jgi:hypothetical protein